MAEHNQFEELCALAATGQITEEESAELQSHLAECPECGQLKDELVGLGAFCLSVERHAEVDLPYRHTEIKQRVLRNLQVPGEQFTSSAREQIPNRTFRFPAFNVTSIFGRPTTWVYAAALVLVAVLGFAFGSYRHSSRLSEPNVAAVESTRPSQDTGTPVQDTVKPGGSKRDERGSAFAAADLQARLTAAEAARDSLEKELAEAKKKAADLQDARDREDATIVALQTSGETDRNNLQSAREQLRKSEEMRAVINADLVAAQYQIRDLEAKSLQQSAAAERERQRLLMASSSEMRDVIGARNLHIVDIYDTKTSGGRKRPFGRVFYVEGQSLVFYAYDLEGVTPSDTKITFTVWGETANVKSAKTYNLGVLRSDDPGQSRWKLSFDDPKVLAKINAVYVTADPGNSPKSEPSRRKLMYAFLGSPNHP